MRFLVDANVLSEVTKPEPRDSVVAWLRRREPELAVNGVVLGEIRFGILLLPQGKRRERLQQWFDGVVRQIHCLPWEATTGLRWAELLADLRRRGLAMPIKDSWIAATALEHDLQVVTRNRRDFELAGLEVLDPFE